MSAIRLFSCVATPATGLRDPGKERQEELPLEKVPPDAFRTKALAARLQSTWGPHWKCEEKAKGLGNVGDTIELLLRVSKHM